MNYLFIYLYFQLTPRITADHKDQIFPQLISAYPTFYGTPKFVKLFVTAHYMSVS